MSPSISDLRRTGLALGSLLIVTILFGYGQNRLGFMGGRIALPKLLWLATAIWAWYIQPFLLLADSRLKGLERQAILGLILLMGVRAVVEAGMLYSTRNWNPIYGVAFNFLAMAWLVWSAWRGRGLLAAHLFALSLMFVPECGFALYMKSQFVTAGAAPIYFVPDDPRYHMILQLTWAAVAAAWVWQLYFFRYWLWPR